MPRDSSHLLKCQAFTISSVQARRQFEVHLIDTSDLTATCHGIPVTFFVALQFMLWPLTDIHVVSHNKVMNDALHVN